ncbi:MAG: WecB/TagA/CpsF family glycosyltransferase [Thermodesulfobacteriota bacterium]
MKENIKFLGVSMHPWTMQETIEEIAHRLDEGVFTQHVVVNVAKLVNSQNDNFLRESIDSCHIINIDGTGVVWGGRLVGHDIPERVAGIDMFFELLSLASRRLEPVYLLGAQPEIIKETVEKLRITFPELKIAGWHHGYFWDDEAAMAEEIMRSGATMLFVAISTPKKELFITRWRDKLGVKFAMGVGGTFDIVSGKTKRAPKLMQNFGLEWFYRVLQEPRRMWKRYLFTNTKFMFLLIKEITGKIFK